MRLQQCVGDQDVCGFLEILVQDEDECLRIEAGWRIMVQEGYAAIVFA